MERIPLRLDGEVRGEVRIYPEGLRTVFEASCPPVGRLVRLWLHGDGGARACLGVMAPRGGRLYLRRAFTRRELQSFPRPPRYAGEAEPEKAAPETEPEAGEKAADIFWEVLPNPWSLFSDTYSKTLLLRYRGTMAARTAEGLLLALPLRGAPPVLRGAKYLESRPIGGTDCAVYRMG